MKEIRLYPQKIIASKNVEDVENLFIKKTLQISLSDKKLTRFSENSYVIIDFGKEIKGSLRLLTFSNANAKVRIRYGESVSETCANIGEKNATNDHSVRDFYVSPPRLSDQTYINSGFRFVRLDVEKGELNVKSVLVEAKVFDGKPVYEYEGKDDAIKKIFETAKRTVDLCVSSDYVWDGIKRDRLVWYGDLHPETIALISVYGRVKQVEKSIDAARKEYKLPSWLNFFPSYSMWWIIVVCDYYQANKCEAFTKKQLPYLKNLIALMDKHVKDDGELNYPAYFTDWPTFQTPAAVEGVRAINVIAIKKAIILLEAFGEKTDFAQKLLDKLLKKEINGYGKKQIIALKALATGKLIDSDYELLVKNGSEGFSTFMSYYILAAIALVNKDKAIELMKEYFGEMIKLGATTFWEDFDITWAKNACKLDELPKENQKDIHGDFGAFCYQGFRHSLCHGWSAGVIKFIKDYCK